jgi:hypothetical protein
MKFVAAKTLLQKNIVTKTKGMKNVPASMSHLPDTLPGLLILQQDLATRLSRSRLFCQPSSFEADTLRKQNDHLKKQLFFLTVEMEKLRLMGNPEEEMV